MISDGGALFTCHWHTISERPIEVHRIRVGHRYVHGHEIKSDVIPFNRIVKLKINDYAYAHATTMSAEMENRENSRPEDQDVIMEVADPPASAPALSNGEPGEPEPQEEERTLTDHLNKKLLSSFLEKLDSGAVQFPAGVQDPAAEDEEEDEFKA